MIFIFYLGFALDLVLYPPVVVVDEQDVDGDRGVDEEGHGEEEDEGVLDSFLRFLPAHLIVQAKLQSYKEIWSFKFLPKFWMILTKVLNLHTMGLNSKSKFGHHEQDRHHQGYDQGDPERGNNTIDIWWLLQRWKR